MTFFLFRAIYFFFARALSLSFNVPHFDHNRFSSHDKRGISPRPLFRLPYKPQTTDSSFQIPRSSSRAYKRGAHARALRKRRTGEMTFYDGFARAFRDEAPFAINPDDISDDP